MNTMTTAEAMRKSSLTTKEKKMRKSSETSFLSLPYDVVLNCLSRVSRTHDPILSLVSKSFGSLVASPDLEAARSCILNTERCLYVCLKLNTDHNPSWFILSQTPKHKLIPLPRFPYPHPNRSTCVSTGSEIYMLGGCVTKGKKSRRAYVLDCKSHQWRRLPKMRIARKEAAANVIGGKIYVYGGCSREYDSIDWGETYDPKTQTWEPFPSRPGYTHLYNMGVTACGRIVGGVFYLYNGTLISGKVYDHKKVGKLYLCRNVCKVQIGYKGYKSYAYFLATVSNGKLQLFCCHGRPWSKLETKVGGLDGMSCNYLLSVTNTGERSRLTVWWKKFTKECKTEVWCAQISFEISVMCKELWGVVEWSENVFTFHGSESESDSDSFLLHNELVTLGRH